MCEAIGVVLASFGGGWWGAALFLQCGHEACEQWGLGS